MSQFFAQKEKQQLFLSFLNGLQKEDIVKNANDFEIIFMIFCSQVFIYLITLKYTNLIQAKKSKDYANILGLLEAGKGIFPPEKFSVYQDHDLWVSHVNIILESKILKNINGTHTIHFKKGSPFNEILHDILMKMLSVGFKSGFLMEILKELEKRYIFDPKILAEFRVQKK